MVRFLLRKSRSTRSNKAVFLILELRPKFCLQTKLIFLEKTRQGGWEEAGRKGIREKKLSFVV